MKRIETTSMSLHIMAMIFMVCDHLWAMVIPGNDWLTCVGRLTFPIFAFLIVEGYHHTSNLKKYVLRLGIFALLSEIPFNLAMGSSLVYPIHQNVLCTFLLGILLIYMNERAKAKGGIARRIIMAIVTIVLAMVLGLITFVDYNGEGLLMILVFYFFRGNRWWHKVLQLLAMLYINIEMIKGISFEINLFGDTFFLSRQVFAVLALIPIFLYRGKEGPKNKALQYTYYAFYPVHLLILALIQMYVL